MCQSCCLQDCGTLGSGDCNAVDFKINCLHRIFPPSLFLVDSAEFTFFHTSAAFDTLVLVNDMWILDRAHDCSGRTVAGTQRTSAALVTVDVEGEKRLTYTCRTAFFLDVCFVLVAEEMKGGEYRVGSCLAQAAQ